MRGFHNHHYLDCATHICEGYICGRLWNLGAFPTLELVDNGGIVAGEVYGIDAKTLGRLDALEAYNSKAQTGSYLRRTLTVISLAGPRMLADVYVGNMELDGAELIDTERFTSYMAWQQRKNRGEVA